MVKHRINGHRPFAEAFALSAPASRAATTSSVEAITADNRRTLDGSAIVSVEMIGKDLGGARVAFTLGSDLIVGSAPLEEAELLLAEPQFASAAYLLSLTGGDGLSFDFIDTDEALDGSQILPAAKIGETILTARRWQEHRRKAPVAADRLWLVATLRPNGFGKDALLALQHALTQQAIRAGRCRVVGAKPETSWLAKIDPGLMRRWLHDARALLVGGGCHLLEPRGTRIRPPVVVGRVRHEEDRDAGFASPAKPALPPLKRGYRLVPELCVREPGLSRHVLVWREVSATAVEQPDGTVVIEAGSLFAATPRSGVQSCIVRKLDQMGAAGLFEHAGDGVRRLTRPVQVSTLTNALRLATISKLPGKGRWRIAA